MVGIVSTHSVFLSYSIDDRHTATAVYSMLEENGIKCRLSPSDVSDSPNYTENAIKMLDECAILMLIFSANANSCPSVWQEVRHAFTEHKTIILLRVENVDVGEHLKPFLLDAYWRDAPPEQTFGEELLPDILHALNIQAQSNIFAEKLLIQQRVQEAKNNDDAIDALIADYLPYIKSEASKVIGHTVTEQDDEFSIALIGFHDAIKSYSETRGAFLKYASVVIRRRLIDHYRKEKRHTEQISADKPISYGSEVAVRDTIQNDLDEYSIIDIRDATRQEIIELTQQLQSFGLSLVDIVDNCPKQDRTLASCHKALVYARSNPELITTMKRTKKLPLASLTLGSGVERKTLERHRKYLMALLLIYSNGYEIIRDHLKQVLNPA